MILCQPHNLTVCNRSRCYYPHFTDGETEVQRDKCLAQSHTDSTDGAEREPSSGSLLSKSSNPSTTQPWYGALLGTFSNWARALCKKASLPTYFRGEEARAQMRKIIGRGHTAEPEVKASRLTPKLDLFPIICTAVSALGCCGKRCRGHWCIEIGWSLCFQFFWVHTQNCVSLKIKQIKNSTYTLCFQLFRG